MYMIHENLWSCFYHFNLADFDAWMEGWVDTNRQIHIYIYIYRDKSIIYRDKQIVWTLELSHRHFDSAFHWQFLCARGQTTRADLKHKSNTLLCSHMYIYTCFPSMYVHSDIIDIDMNMYACAYIQFSLCIFRSICVFRSEIFVNRQRKRHGFARAQAEILQAHCAHAWGHQLAMNNAERKKNQVAKFGPVARTSRNHQQQYVCQQQILGFWKIR